MNFCFSFEYMRLSDWLSICQYCGNLVMKCNFSCLWMSNVLGTECAPYKLAFLHYYSYYHVISCELKL